MSEDQKNTIKIFGIFLFMLFVIGCLGSMFAQSIDKINELETQISVLEQKSYQDLKLTPELCVDDDNNLVIVITKDFNGVTYPFCINIFKTRTSFKFEKYSIVLPKKEAINLANSILFTYNFVYKKKEPINDQEK